MNNSLQEKRTPSALKMVFYLILALLVGLNFFIRPHEPHFGIDKYPGFWAVFGLVMAVLLARVAKGAAHTFLGRSEDFYTRKEKTENPS